jgi:hypothetical protein
VQAIGPTLREKKLYFLEDYFDKLKELLMELRITDKPERIYDVDERDED